MFCAVTGTVLVQVMGLLAQVQVNGSDRHHQTHPAVALARDGGFIVTWAIGPFPHDICAQPFNRAAAPAGVQTRTTICEAA